MQIKDPYILLVSFRLKCQHRQNWMADSHTQDTSILIANMIKHIYHYKHVQCISGTIECYHNFFKREIKYKKYLMCIGPCIILINEE